MSNSLENPSTPWSRWKAHPADPLWLALLTAGLITAGLLMFLFMFIQHPRRLLMVSGFTLVGSWLFFVGVSAMNAYLSSQPKLPRPVPGKALKPSED